MGHWISPTGEVHPNPDHWCYMRAHPRLFGFTKAEASRWEIEDREPLLDLALVRGWIRVRGKQPHLAFMFEVLDPDVVRRIAVFMRKLEPERRERALFDEVGTGQSWYEPFTWISGEGAQAVLEASGDRRALIRWESTA